MSQVNERRARELLTTIGASGKMGTEAIALLQGALDEAEARGRPQWRPVSEKPERVGQYLVQHRHGDWSRCFWSGVAWHMGMHPGALTMPDVTWWSDVPVPPTPTTEKD